MKRKNEKYKKYTRSERKYMQSKHVVINKWKWELATYNCDFYFQVRESPAPLTTPTPAPDQGGPVACRSGPVYIEGSVTSILMQGWESECWLHLAKGVRNAGRTWRSALGH